MMLLVSDIQRFCMHDGKGLRTTVFLKGCPLRCQWCHNPETQSGKKQLLYYKSKCIDCGSCNICNQGAHIFEDEHSFNAEKCIACGLCAENCPTRAVELVGQEISIAEIVEAVKADLAFYGGGGGVTLSGGEPFLQGESLLELLKQFKKEGVGVFIETCGFFDEKYLSEAVGLVDCFLWDIKDTDEERHKQFTGVSNKKIMENLFTADRLGLRTVLRCIVVNGVNSDEKHWRNVGAIFKQLKYCEGVELIPYHTFGGSKFQALTGFDNGKTEWIPDEDVLNKARQILLDLGVKVN